MNCAELERLVEALADGSLADAEAAACRAHAKSCPDCSELLALAQLETAEGPPPEMTREVLARTSGPACGRLESVLAAFVDGELETTDRQLAAAHAADCARCRGLIATLERLGRELPRLAVLPTDERFVADVLGATLPVPVQVRRWWRATWPRWVHRPRFASEAAFIGLLVLVLVFATPGSPLEAVPRQALQAARDPALELPVVELDGRLSEVGRAVKSSEPVRAVAAGYESSRAWARQARRWAEGVAEALGTLWEDAASLLQEDRDEASPQTNDTIEETS